MTSRHLRAACWLVHLLFGVVLMAVVARVFDDPWITLGVYLGFAAFTVTVCRPGEMR